MNCAKGTGGNRLETGACELKSDCCGYVADTGSDVPVLYLVFNVIHYVELYG